MTCWGWIPILSGRINPSKVILDIQRDACRLDDNDFLITPKGFRNASGYEKAHRSVLDLELRRSIRQRLGTKEGEDCFYYVKRLSEESSKALKLIVVAIGEDYFVKVVGFFEYFGEWSAPGFFRRICKWFRHESCQNRPPQFITMGTIESIDLRGRVKYSLQPLIKAFNKQAFVVVRDIYHEHVYASRADLALKPVQADSWPEACMAIFNQYQEKIIDYHRTIKAYMETVRKEHDPDLIEEITSAKGEMIYALSFIRLFGSQLPCWAKSSIENSLKSFENLAEKCELILSMKAGLRNPVTVILAMVAIFFTAFTCFREFYSVGQALLCSSGIVVLLGIIALSLLKLLRSGRT